jgi:DNA invertase Pin-like site-specific DNA recombinase
MERFVGYYRVSTSQQGRSGLGLEAQRAAVRSFVESRGGKLVEEYTEVQTGKGSDALALRPELGKAMKATKKHRARLIVSKLDRLSRNVHFISGVMEQKVDFLTVDAPTADSFMLHIYASVAEQERKRIAQRISDALAAKKAKGETVGNLANLRPHNEERSAKAKEFAEGLARTLKAYRKTGMTQRAMVDELNAQGIKTARGGQWSLMQLQRVLSRLEAH